MDQRSETEAPERSYGGVRWASRNGISGWCHVWSDGTILPVLRGFDGGEDGGEDDDTGTDDTEDDGGEDDDDEDIDAKEKDPGKLRSRIKELCDENASWRTKLKGVRAERDTAQSELADAKTKIKDLEDGKGGGDDALKARISELETANAQLTKDNDTLKGEASKGKVEKQVSAVATKLNIEDDMDYIMYVLERNEMLSVDEDGDIEDLNINLKRLLKKGKLSVASGDDGDDSEDDEGATSGASRSTGKSFNGRKKSSATTDRAKLLDKYPALRR